MPTPSIKPVKVNWGWYGNYDGYFDIALLDVRGMQFNSYQDMVINYLLNNDASQLNLGKADVNADGNINITGAVMLIDKLLHQ